MERFIAVLIILCSIPPLSCVHPPRGNENPGEPQPQRTGSKLEEKDAGIEFHCNNKVVAGQVLVKFRQVREWQPKNIEALAEKITHGPAFIERVGNSEVLLVRSMAGRSVDALIDDFKAGELSNEIEYVEPDYVLRLDSMMSHLPEDPDLDKQWGLKKIGADSAWMVDTQCCTNVVAVVDSGIDYTHEDLRDNVWLSPQDFSVQLGAELIRCPTGSHGFDATVPYSGSDSQKCNPSYANSHGTQVAGIISATSNKDGGVGVSWKTKIMAIKYTRSNGEGCVSDVVRALDFVVAASKSINIRVVNSSFGFYLSDFDLCGSTSNTLLTAFERVNAQNILIVASNGDRPVDTATTPHYPSGYNLSNLIAVMATDESDEKYYFSGRDATATNLIGAPGNHIWTTVTGNRYEYKEGTSFAAPFVSGSAALVLSNVKNNCDKLTAEALRRALLDSADKRPSLENFVKYGRRLNVNTAINKCKDYLH